MSTGVVIAFNPLRGYILIQTEQGEFVLFELLDSISISRGDKLAGNLGGLGRETLTHLEQNRRFEAYGQTGPSSLAACKKIFSG